MQNDTKNFLVDSVRIEINYEHYLRLQAIDMHDFSLVKKKVSQEHNITDQAYLDKAIVYLKRYYALQVLDPLNLQAASKPIDPFWHTHFLYSRRFHAFSHEVFGGFVHHEPLLLNDKLAITFVENLYNQTLKKHIRVFGEVDDTFVPTEPEKGMCCTMIAADNYSVLTPYALFPKEESLISPHILKDRF